MRTGNRFPCRIFHSPSLSFSLSLFLGLLVIFLFCVFFFMNQLWGWAARLTDNNIIQSDCTQRSRAHVATWKQQVRRQMPGATFPNNNWMSQKKLMVFRFGLGGVPIILSHFWVLHGFTWLFWVSVKAILQFFKNRFGAEKYTFHFRPT